MKRKGSLELSINAIVIIIIAITMLGLGLTFMKSTFGGVTEQFGNVNDAMKKEMIDRFKDSTKSVDLNVFELQMKRGEKKEIYLAINNNLESAAKFQISCLTCQRKCPTDPDGGVEDMFDAYACLTTDSTTGAIRTVENHKDDDHTDPSWYPAIFNGTCSSIREINSIDYPKRDDKGAIIKDTDGNPEIDTPAFLKAESERCNGISVKALANKEIKRGEIDVSAVYVAVSSNAVPDTYLMPMHVYGTPPDATSGSKIDKVLNLYITVTS